MHAARARLNAIPLADLTRTTALRKAKAAFHFACSHLLALTLVPAISLNAVRPHFLALTWLQPTLGFDTCSVQRLSGSVLI